MDNMSPIPAWVFHDQRGLKITAWAVTAVIFVLNTYLLIRAIFRVS